MGSTLSSGEEAVVKLLQHILSTRGLTCDKGTLEKLLVWIQERQLIPTVDAAFELSTWDRIGMELWEEVSRGSRDAVKLATGWRLIKQVLKDMGAERAAAASVLVETSPSCPGGGAAAAGAPPPNPVGGGPSCPGGGAAAAGTPSRTLFEGARPPSVKKSSSGAPASAARPKGAAGLDHGAVSTSPSDQADPSPERGEQSAAAPKLCPSLPSSTPPSPASPAPERRAASSVLTKGASGSSPALDLRELSQRLQELEAKVNSGVTRGPSRPPDFPRPVPPPCGGMTGGLGGNDPVTRWRRIIRDAVVEGALTDVMAIPAFTDAQGNDHWEALNWKIVKELKSAVTQYGLKSAYTALVIQQIFSAHTFTPYDAGMLIQTILPLSQQLQFVDEWKNLCDAAVAVQRQQNDPLFGVTTEMLMGTSPFCNAERQARLRVEALRLSLELALKALLAVHDEKVAPAFMSIRQGPTEPYSQFIDRLRAAISSHPDLGSEMQEMFLHMLAFDNANEKTKKALSLLPLGSTTAQMLEAAEQMLEQERAAYIAAEVAAALRPLIRALKQKGRKRDKKCFNCGKIGHFRAQCWQLPESQAPRQRSQFPAKWCDHCNKSSHNTWECRRKGTKGPSTTRPRATTQGQGAWNATAPPHGEAQEWQQQ
ncbi:PREDICTED: endogenous retrovirus group K member 9 Gag polyprotein-like [Tinamus guttatus]|uniref:endogenous retrovirus group K member 9 Gag polyprotein-like n=1 Tax=Tinamus guttatus TaxID=94827 RepID=UPI00052E98F4|nr:PREDICTED: endogenous retrovirus group K member 9 Gag polyprotein-like [Tinamus guttatus]